MDGGAEPPCSHYAAPATLHKIHLVLNRLREATHAARPIIMQGWNGPLGCYLHLSVFPATSNLLMMIKEQRGSAALWKRAPSSREWPRIHNHPELKPLFDKNQEKLAGRLPGPLVSPLPHRTRSGWTPQIQPAAVKLSYCFRGYTKFRRHKKRQWWFFFFLYYCKYVMIMPRRWVWIPANTTSTVIINANLNAE